ncbi:hypothetical protein GQ43DRAFT_364214 [Delitschia confertaspora ATCC 74209]|uniref:alpha-galactosidase n=1 Tax=Delitschia confertaspora ATCC 74209 TaxID=1513339 RepID=A0A9P4JSB5_9PLEO|nr:hypothetical protein GQ43DRAFT_364214 [Delitschia confertaspora ATCC 74209]
MLLWLLWTALFVCSSQAQQMFVRGQKFQIILSAKPDITKSPLPPTDAPVWDIDLFDNEAAVIAGLKAQGKIVICYFSAGTWEDWREDAKEFPDSDKGKVLPEWPNEKWIRTSSTKVRDIMSKRIKLAADKGCDAIDPDNTGRYANLTQQNDNGLNLKSTDLVDYMTFLAKTAAGYGMKTGLKNSLDIIPAVSSIMDFAVNEQCASLNECTAYASFLASNKPVFHIEYPSKFPVTDQDRRIDCNSAGVEGMSTVMKNLTLSGYTYYCDGSYVDTPVTGGTNWHPKPPKSTTTRTPRPTPTPTARPTSTPRPPTSTFSPTSTMITWPTPTTKPTSTSRTTTSSRPTSTPGGGQPGCTQKHWDQCGGNDWKGCTVCAAGFTCKGVSPPWYYQCL